MQSQIQAKECQTQQPIRPELSENAPLCDITKKIHESVFAQNQALNSLANTELMNEYNFDQFYAKHVQKAGGEDGVPFHSFSLLAQGSQVPPQQHSQINKLCKS